jgi:hypothetical protein
LTSRPTQDLLLGLIGVDTIPVNVHDQACSP